MLIDRLFRLLPFPIPTVCFVALTPFAALSAWQLGACNAGCSNEVEQVVVLDAGVPADLCSACADPGSPWPGTCAVVDEGPPIAIACSEMVCPE
jgi:hypothetical protein